MRLYHCNSPLSGFPMCTRLLVSACLLIFAIEFAHAERIEKIHYVGVDRSSGTAYLYDQNFTRLPDNPLVSGTSWEPLTDQVLWLTGYRVDAVRRNADGSIDVVSDNPAYSEMNHHFVMAYLSADRPLPLPCLLHTSPIVSGSELTDVLLPPGYAYKLQGGGIYGASWHWMNPANVPLDEQVFLRFVYLLDTEDQGYKNTEVSWIGAAPCSEDFAVPSGVFTKEGPSVQAMQAQRIIAVLPHTHDHVKVMQLRANGETLLSIRPDYSRTYAAHDDVGEGATPWHLHKDHLAPGGLSTWAPGISGPVVPANSLYTAYGRFRNPHPRAIDNMLIFITFWEPLAPQ